MARPTNAALLAGRILLGGFFLFSASGHFLRTADLAQAASAAGVPFPMLSVLGTGALLLLGGAALVLGVMPRIGLAALIVFFVGVTPMMHAFWAIDDPQASAMQLASFARNVALLGACLAMLALPTPWAYSLSAYLRAWQRAHVPRGAL